MRADRRGADVGAGEGGIVDVALCVGGFAGVGERLFAAPWSAFVVDPVGGALAVKFARDEFNGQRGFDKDAWPVGPDKRLAAL